MKKYLFGLFALALAVAFSAFTAPKSSSLDPVIYEYDGSGDITSIDSWDVVMASPCASTTVDVICTVTFESQSQTFAQFISDKNQAAIVSASETSDERYVEP